MLWCLVGAQTALLLDVPQDLPESVRLDGRLKALRRALSNLIDNAMRYGGEACIDVVKLDAAIRVCVEDTGPALPEAELVRVFEPFYRVEGSRSRETGGTVLGLAIARQVARSHGSDVHLGNRQSSGLRAVLELPLAQPVLQP